MPNWLWWVLGGVGIYAIALIVGLVACNLSS